MHSSNFLLVRKKLGEGSSPCLYGDMLVAWVMMECVSAFFIYFDVGNVGIFLFANVEEWLS